MNDSYLTGTHLNDMTVFGPIFHDDELVGFAASRAHWLDVGAKDPGGPMDSTDDLPGGHPPRPDQGRRGRDPATRRHRSARPQQPLLLPGDRRPRRPDRLRSHRAEAAARRSSTGTDRRRSPRRGTQIFAQTERLEREAVAAIPDGVYDAEGCLDDDGVSTRAVLGPRSRSRSRGDEMTIDLSETRRLQAGPVNCGEAQAISACRVAYKLLINPRQPAERRRVPPARPCDVRPGSMLGAQEPAPCQWYFSQLGLLIDLVVKALADVMPEQAAGASYGDSMVISLSGIDHRNGRPWLDLEPTVGGWGAWNGSDGEAG